jgi:REP-associated tyrosine transposase
VSFYRRNLPHIQKDYAPHFVTFVTKSRLLLPDWARTVVLDCCTYGHDKKYNLRVAVVMPEHVHLILTPLVDLERSSMFHLHKILRSIKSFSARKINEELSRGALWQEESFDHVLRSSENLDAKIAYVLANPVRRGLVNLPEEYLWLWRKPIDSGRP